MYKLLQINTTCNYSSTGRIAEQIGQLALDCGWDCYLIHGPRYVNPSKLKTIQSVNLFQEKIHALESRIFDNHGLSSRSSTKKIIEKIKEIKPDIIHLHNIHGYYINYKLLFDFFSKTNIPIVWTLHDCWSFTGHCTHFDYINCEKWKSHCYKCENKKSYPASYLLDNSFNNFSIKKKYFTSIKNLTIIPVSYWLEGLVRNSFFKDVPGIRIETIHNGIDLNIFKPSERQDIINLKKKLNISTKKIILGCANQWYAKKGYEDFINLRKLLNDSFAIVMIGVNEKQKQELTRLGIIGVTKTQDANELALYYSSADLFINLTYEDNYPTTNLEAIACGTPIITYNTGGSVEAVGKETGEIVKKGDFNMLCQTIQSMIDKGKNISACRNQAINCFNKDDKFKRYISIYSSILGIRM